jgi:hypothetical protein
MIGTWEKRRECRGGDGLVCAIYNREEGGGRRRGEMWGPHVGVSARSRGRQPSRRCRLAVTRAAAATGRARRVFSPEQRGCPMPRGRRARIPWAAAATGSRQRRKCMGGPPDSWILPCSFNPSAAAQPAKI